MLPRWHILLGAIFTLAIWILAPQTSIFFLILIFLSSFLIDFDHYAVACIKNKKLRLSHALVYYKKLSKKIDADKKKGLRKRYDFHVFHTIEFHILIALLGFLWEGFFYVFIGMVFHSLTDLIYFYYKDIIHIREFFFFSWIAKRLERTV